MPFNDEQNRGYNLIRHGIGAFGILGAAATGGYFLVNKMSNAQSGLRLMLNGVHKTQQINLIKVSANGNRIDKQIAIEDNAALRKTKLMLTRTGKFDPNDRIFKSNFGAMAERSAGVSGMLGAIDDLFQQSANSGLSRGINQIKNGSFSPGTKLKNSNLSRSAQEVVGNVLKMISGVATEGQTQEETMAMINNIAANMEEKHGNNIISNVLKQKGSVIASAAGDFDDNLYETYINSNNYSNIPEINKDKVLDMNKTIADLADDITDEPMKEITAMVNNSKQAIEGALDVMARVENNEDIGHRDFIKSQNIVDILMIGKQNEIEIAHKAGDMLNSFESTVLGFTGSQDNEASATDILLKRNTSRSGEGIQLSINGQRESDLNIRSARKHTVTLRGNTGKQVKDAVNISMDLMGHHQRQSAKEYKNSPFDIKVNKSNKKLVQDNIEMLIGSHEKSAAEEFGSNWKSSKYSVTPDRGNVKLTMTSDISINGTIHSIENNVFVPVLYDNKKMTTGGTETVVPHYKTKDDKLLNYSQKYGQMKSYEVSNFNKSFGADIKALEEGRLQLKEGQTLNDMMEYRRKQLSSQTVDKMKGLDHFQHINISGREKIVDEGFLDDNDVNHIKKRLRSAEAGLAEAISSNEQTEIHRYSDQITKYNDIIKNKSGIRANGSAAIDMNKARSSQPDNIIHPGIGSKNSGALGIGNMRTPDQIFVEFSSKGVLGKQEMVGLRGIGSNTAKIQRDMLKVYMDWRVVDGIDGIGGLSDQTVDRMIKAKSTRVMSYNHDKTIDTIESLKNNHRAARRGVTHYTVVKSHLNAMEYGGGTGLEKGKFMAAIKGELFKPVSDAFDKRAEEGIDIANPAIKWAMNNNVDSFEMDISPEEIIFKGITEKETVRVKDIVGESIHSTSKTKNKDKGQLRFRKNGSVVSIVKITGATDLTKQSDKLSTGKSSDGLSKFKLSNREIDDNYHIDQKTFSDAKMAEIKQKMNDMKYGDLKKMMIDINNGTIETNFKVRGINYGSESQVRELKQAIYSELNNHNVDSLVETFASEVSNGLDDKTMGDIKKLDSLHIHRLTVDKHLVNKNNGGFGKRVLSKMIKDINVDFWENIVDAVDVGNDRGLDQILDASLSENGTTKLSVTQEKTNVIRKILQLTDPNLDENAFKLESDNTFEGLSRDKIKQIIKSVAAGNTDIDSLPELSMNISDNMTNMTGLLDDFGENLSKDIFGDVGDKNGAVNDIQRIMAESLNGRWSAKVDADSASAKGIHTDVGYLGSDAIQISSTDAADSMKIFKAMRESCGSKEGVPFDTFKLMALEYHGQTELVDMINKARSAGQLPVLETLKSLEPITSAYGKQSTLEYDNKIKIDEVRNILKNKKINELTENDLLELKKLSGSFVEFNGSDQKNWAINMRESLDGTHDNAIKQVHHDGLYFRRMTADSAAYTIEDGKIIIGDDLKQTLKVLKAFAINVDDIDQSEMVSNARKSELLNEFYEHASSRLVGKKSQMTQELLKAKIPGFQATLAPGGTYMNMLNELGGGNVFKNVTKTVHNGQTMLNPDFNQMIMSKTAFKKHIGGFKDKTFNDILRDHEAMALKFKGYFNEHGIIDDSSIDAIATDVASGKIKNWGIGYRDSQMSSLNTQAMNIDVFDDSILEKKMSTADFKMVQGFIFANETTVNIMGGDFDHDMTQGVYANTNKADTQAIKSIMKNQRLYLTERNSNAIVAFDGNPFDIRNLRNQMNKEMHVSKSGDILKSADMMLDGIGKTLRDSNNMYTSDYTLKSLLGRGMNFSSGAQVLDKKLGYSLSTDIITSNESNVLKINNSKMIGGQWSGLERLLSSTDSNKNITLTGTGSKIDNYLRNGGDYNALITELSQDPAINTEKLNIIKRTLSQRKSFINENIGSDYNSMKNDLYLNDINYAKIADNASAKLGTNDMQKLLTKYTSDIESELDINNFGSAAEMKKSAYDQAKMKIYAENYQGFIQEKKATPTAWKETRFSWFQSASAMHSSNTRFGKETVFQDMLPFLEWQKQQLSMSAKHGTPLIIDHMTDVRKTLTGMAVKDNGSLNNYSKGISATELAAVKKEFNSLLEDTIKNGDAGEASGLKILNQRIAAKDNKALNAYASFMTGDYKGTISTQGEKKFLSEVAMSGNKELGKQSGKIMSDMRAVATGRRLRFESGEDYMNSNDILKEIYDKDNMKMNNDLLNMQRRAWNSNEFKALYNQLHLNDTSHLGIEDKMVMAFDASNSENGSGFLQKRLQFDSNLGMTKEVMERINAGKIAEINQGTANAINRLTQSDYQSYSSLTDIKHKLLKGNSPDTSLRGKIANAINGSFDGSSKFGIGMAVAGAAGFVLFQALHPSASNELGKTPGRSGEYWEKQNSKKNEKDNSSVTHGRKKTSAINASIINYKNMSEKTSRISNLTMGNKRIRQSSLRDRMLSLSR